MPPNDFGRDRFIRHNGQRLRIGMVRTVQPGEAESNEDFERRMDDMADALEAMSGVLSVEYEFERRKGRIVQCLFDVAHEPRPECVLADSATAGGRSGTPRGRRAA